MSTMTRTAALLTAAAVLLAGCSSSGPSPAEKASASKSTAAALDQVYLHGVRDVWVGTTVTHAAEIHIAHVICKGLDGGVTFSRMVEAISSGLTPEHAGTVIGAAVAVYCPSHADMSTSSP